MESLLIPFHISYISHKFGEIFNDRFYLMYYLDILLCYLIVVDDAENVSNFFLEEDLFLEESLYLRVDGPQEICFGPWPSPFVYFVSKINQDKENASVSWDMSRQEI